MRINLKCFSNLAKRHSCDYQVATTMDLSDGATVDKLMRMTGIPADDVKVVFVNGRKSGVGQSLKDGDRVALVPATGGM